MGLCPNAKSAFSIFEVHHEINQKFNFKTRLKLWHIMPYISKYMMETYWVKPLTVVLAFPYIVKTSDRQLNDTMHVSIRVLFVTSYNLNNAMKAWTTHSINETHGIHLLKCTIKVSFLLLEFFWSKMRIYFVLNVTVGDFILYLKHEKQVFIAEKCFFL